MSRSPTADPKFDGTSVAVSHVPSQSLSIRPINSADILEPPTMFPRKENPTPSAAAPMRRNPVRAALAAGRPSIGTWVSLGDLMATRVLSRVGFDWLCVDMEHSAIDWQLAATLFAAIADGGCTPLCRVPRGSHENIKRALDAGAHGIVVPMINTVEEAREAIAAAHYPPFGNRSVGGGSHFLNFGTSPDTYYKGANDEVLVILQTESPEGIANAPAIYALPGVHGIFIGPNDLRAMMRDPVSGADPTPAEHEVAVQRVLAVGKATGCPVGIHTFTTADCAARLEQGFQFVAMGSELQFMAARAQEVAVALGLGDGGAARGLPKY